MLSKQWNAEREGLPALSSSPLYPIVARFMLNLKGFYELRV